MPPLAEAVLAAAIDALARRGGPPKTDAVLAEYSKDARAVSVAVLATVGGSKTKPGMEPPRGYVSQRLLTLADELDNEGV